MISIVFRKAKYLQYFETPLFHYHVGKKLKNFEFYVNKLFSWKKNHNSTGMDYYKWNLS